MSYDESQDAHKLSNYKEWKKTAHIVQNVEIDLASTGISMEDVALMEKYLTDKTIFVLTGKIGFVVISPESNGVWKDGELIKYDTPKQLVNAIKLLLFNFNKVSLPPEENKLLSC